jgi:regulatory protein
MPGTQKPKPELNERSAYVAALTLLARRELSEFQVRARLGRKGYPEEEITEAIERLKRERAIDDVRVAAAIARTETGVKRRGKLRVRRQIESAGIAPAVARGAVDEVFDDLDNDALIVSALRKRLRGDRPIADEREFQRLYRYLTAQGFESDLILRVLRARRGSVRSPDADD